MITLVRPPVLVAKWAHTTPTCPPVGLAYVAASLQARGHAVSVVDAIGEKPDQFVPVDDGRFLAHGLTAEQIAEKVAPDTRVIGISCMFSHEWPLIRQLVSALRRRAPKALIVAGGEHITALPEYSLESAPELDAGVIGEGEEVICALVEAWMSDKPLALVNGIVYRDAGRIRKNLPQARIRAVDAIPEPAWELFPVAAYLDNGYGFGVNRGRSMPIVATRGCPYQCTFCSNPAMWGTRWIARAPERVLDEIKRYIDTYKADNIDFYDLTAIVKKDWVVKFCNMVKGSGFTFTWQLPSGTRSEAIDAEVSRLLYESGCRNMSYAPESGSPRVLKLIKKHVKLDRMADSMRTAIACGINCKANIIIGFPGETHGDVWKSIWFCVRMAWLGLHDVSISPFSPYPGSELFEDLRKAGRIRELDDAYFYSLAAYTDVTASVSYSEHIGDRALNFYRLAGMAAFYAMQYLRFPRRIFQTIRNMFSEHQESRLEMSLRDLYVRLSKARG